MAPPPVSAGNGMPGKAAIRPSQTRVAGCPVKRRVLLHQLRRHRGALVHGGLPKVRQEALNLVDVILFKNSCSARMRPRQQRMSNDVRSPVLGTTRVRPLSMSNGHVHSHGNIRSSQVGGTPLTCPIRRERPRCGLRNTNGNTRGWEGGGGSDGGACLLQPPALPAPNRLSPHCAPASSPVSIRVSRSSAPTRPFARSPPTSFRAGGDEESPVSTATLKHLREAAPVPRGRRGLARAGITSLDDDERGGQCTAPPEHPIERDILCGC